MQAVILAAGESSRFFPLSEGMHKSMTQILGKPILHYTLDEVVKCGIKNIIIVDGEPETAAVQRRSIREYFGNGSTWGVTISYARQSEPLGMGDAILRAKGHLRKDEDFIVLNPNHVNASDFIPRMLEKKERMKADMVLLATPEEQTWKYGALSLEGDRVRGVVEKPAQGTEPSKTRIVGIYLCAHTFPKFLEKHAGVEDQLEAAIDDFAKEMDVRANVITPTNPSEPVTFPLKYSWDLFKIKDYLLRRLGKRISPKAEVSDRALLTGNVVIEDGAKVLENSIVRGPCYIGKNCIIGNNTLIRENSHIGDNCIVGCFAEIKNTIVMDGSHIHSGFIGDSIIGENTRIGAGIITANRRLDREQINIVIKGKPIQTESTALGTIIGHDTILGIRVNTMPGIVIGANCIIGPHTIVYENVPSNTKYYTRVETVIKRENEANGEVEKSQKKELHEPK